MALAVRALRRGDRKDEAAFRDINLEWIETFFAVEAKDRATLDDPYTYILDPGGAIFLAVDGEEHLGAVAMMVMAEPGSVELAKMGVRPAAQGRGAGRLLISAVLDAARATGMKRIYIETNSKLHTAIHLYHAAGFKPLAKPIPSPYARADVQLELFL